MIGNRVVSLRRLCGYILLLPGCHACMSGYAIGKR